MATDFLDLARTLLPLGRFRRAGEDESPTSKVTPARDLTAANLLELRGTEFGLKFLKYGSSCRLRRRRRSDLSSGQASIGRSLPPVRDLASQSGKPVTGTLTSGHPHGRGPSGF